MKMNMIVVALLSMAALLPVFTYGCGTAEAHVSTPSGWHTFVDGQPLTADQLNGNFAHLHNTFTAGITNANIASNAGISHAKLATPGLVPKAVGGIGTFAGSYCTVNGPCTDLLSGSMNVSAITRAGPGAYYVNFTQPPAAGAFPVIASVTTAPDFRITCNSTAATTTAITIHCFNQGTGADADANFAFVAFGL